MTESTENDGLTEELINDDYLSLIDAIHSGERDEGVERRIVAFLLDSDGWPSFRRGCDFNDLPAERKEQTLRLAIRLYGEKFPVAPDEFRAVSTGRDVPHPRSR